jgi:hypothetical protein
VKTADLVGIATVALMLERSLSLADAYDEVMQNWPKVRQMEVGDPRAFAVVVGLEEP